jgi:hypothetical protein
VYVLVSRRLYRITISLRAMLIPEETKRSIVWLIALVAVLGLYAGLAAILQFLDSGSFLVTVVILACSFGLLFASAVAVHQSESRNASAGVLQLLRENVPLGVVVVAGIALGVFALAFPITPQNAVGPVLGPQCVNFANSGAWTTDEMFCEENNLATCDASRWRWHAPRTCRFQHKSPGAAAKVLGEAPTTVFVGDETVFNVFAQTLRAVQPDYSIPEFKGQDLKLDNKASSLKFVFKRTPSEVAAYLNTAFTDSTPDAVVAGSSAPGGSELASAMRASKVRTRIVVLPPMPVASLLDNTKYSDGRTAQSVVQYAQSLNATFHSASVSGVIDLLTLSSDRADLCIDGVLYESPIYSAAAQILLNMLAFIEEPAPSMEGKDGGGPGVPHDPIMGLFAFALAIFMIFFMDAYALTYVTYWLVPSLEKITWEESVEKLHASIGVGAALPRSASPSVISVSGSSSAGGGLEMSGSIKTNVDEDGDMSEKVLLTASRTHGN